MIKLSIGMPTHNGEHRIAESLGSILPQLSDSVELVISDNCSTDKTPLIIREVVGENPRVHYFRTDTNLGMDRNFDQVVRRARGEFVWIISDDDHLTDPGAVRKVLEAIAAAPDVAAIFANYEDAAQPIDKNYLNVDGNTFFRVTRFKSTLASSCVINKKLWESYDLSGYYGTYWTHIGYLVRALSERNGSVLRDVLVEQIHYGQKEPRWGKRGTFFNVGIDLAKIYLHLERLGYSREIADQARRYVKAKNKWNIPYAKSCGLRVDKKLWNECVHVFGAYPSFWFWDAGLLFLPAGLYRFIFAAWRGVKGMIKKLIRLFPDDSQIKIYAMLGKVKR